MGVLPSSINRISFLMTNLNEYFLINVHLLHVNSSRHLKGIIKVQLLVEYSYYTESNIHYHSSVKG